MTDRIHDPALVRIAGRFHWQFDDGTLLPVVAGGATETATRTEVPADLADLDDDALNELLASVTAEFDSLIDAGSRDVATLTAIADDHDRIEAELGARATAAATADEAIAALTTRVRGSDTPDEGEGDEGDGEEAGEEAEAKEPVLASGNKPNLAAVAARAPKVRVPNRKPSVTITAAADTGFMPGTKIDLSQVAVAMHDRARSLSDGQKAPVATVEIPHTHRVGVDPQENLRTLEDLIGQPTAAALVASGGWCAPSVPIFELFDIGPDTDNIFDLPGVGTSVRAGVMIPTFYGIGDAAGALWTWTEANDIAAATQPAGPDKACLKIPCPTFVECRMEAEGLCVTHGNLSDRAWPELTRQFLSVVMGAHQRRVSAAKIAKVVADLTAVTAAAGAMPSDAAGDLLNVISITAADMRSQYRVSRSRSIDVLLPDWSIDALRSDLAMRAGVDFLSVTDAQVTGWLTARGVRPQFTPDWQPLYNAAPATGWPTTVIFGAWFTGSYVSLDGGAIDLGVVRDSSLNSTNDFTAAWSEQFFQVCRRGPQGRKVTVNLGVDGVTACCP